MELKPIRTKADYEVSLKKISSLLDAPVGSLEAEMLDRLSSLVEEYEEDHYPIGPHGSHRGGQVPQGTDGPIAHVSLPRVLLTFCSL